MCDVLEDALPHDRENMVDNQGTVDEARRNRKGKVDEEPSQNIRPRIVYSRVTGRYVTRRNAAQHDIMRRSISRKHG